MNEAEIKDRLLHWAATWLDYPSGPFEVYRKREWQEGLDFTRYCVLCGGSGQAYHSIEHRPDCLHIEAVKVLGGARSGVYDTNYQIIPLDDTAYANP